jgi:FkbM family methyltransferase
MFYFKYGSFDNNIDITDIVLRNHTKEGIVRIPNDDGVRAQFFTDPVFGVLKSIFVLNSENSTEYQILWNQYVYVDLNLKKIYINETPDYIEAIYPDYVKKLKSIHEKLKIEYGNFYEEVPEMLMAVRYITGNEKVLEIGGNIGRNSLIISYLLNQKQNTQMVSLESNPMIYPQLVHNRDINQLHFHIENSALSNRQLIQKGWDTIESDVVLDGYVKVNTINYQQLVDKYKIDFDTFVLDCEGAFYYIVMDMPEILNNIKMIIMENDYYNINHKKYIDMVLKNKGFYVDYSEAGGWGVCYNNFFEVWKRNI